MIKTVSIGLNPPPQPPQGANVNCLLTQNDIAYYKNSFIKMTYFYYLENTIFYNNINRILYYERLLPNRKKTAVKMTVSL